MATWSDDQKSLKVEMNFDQLTSLSIDTVVTRSKVFYVVFGVLGWVHEFDAMSVSRIESFLLSRHINKRTLESTRESRHSISGDFKPPSSYSAFLTDLVILLQTCNLFQSLVQPNFKTNLWTKTNYFCRIL
jgi:hypothetical protein